MGGVLRLHPPAPCSTGLEHSMPQTPREKELNVSLTFYTKEQEAGA